MNIEKVTKGVKKSLPEVSSRADERDELAKLCCFPETVRHRRDGKEFVGHWKRTLFTE